MISPDGSTGLLPTPRSAPAGANLEFGAVLAVLLVTGWVANHFRSEEHTSELQSPC